MSSDKHAEGTRHCLIIVEEDVLDDPEVYQATKLEHGRDDPQFAPVKEAHDLLAEQAEEETGEPHRVVVEEDDPGVVSVHYSKKSAEAKP